MISWILLLLFGCGAFMVMIAFALPKLFLKNRYNIDEPYDRGLKKYKFADSGHGIVYEPALSVRKYIKQYILVEQYGEKKIKCKIDPNLKYLDYDIVLFDVQDKVFSILNSKDVICEKGYTREVVLPEETSYVTVLLNQADGCVFEKQKGVRISPFHIACYCAACVGLAVCVAFCIKLCFARLFGGLFRESFMMVENSNLITAAFSAVIGVVGVITSLLRLIIKSKK